ncbi:MAG: hypothetical protein HC767_00370 [Akkermansiaceae bacterium]|nr:hypothetical protein [Akkermansiaceae bacterium]
MSGTEKSSKQPGGQSSSMLSELVNKYILQGPGTVVLVLLGGILGWRVEENGWGSMVWLATCLAVKIIRDPYAELNKQDKFSKRHAENTDRLAVFVFGVGVS